ncbi:multiple sugar transport system permease protein [Paenibacillus sp. UNCCL117]|uniref:carbohydrate ABC transporter permease n=1 Tax=unclassified Paenibacillus TaxID=185978 RepID=UPI0008823D5C|nr:MULTISPECIES: carbohydrate ABC transporter permease [unclassified Paenibacillus]SDD07254.1 carbohydrate ABC transporter membrane protein 2, CUT1 family [Paenibacillus sp. cl123]SFW31517.1 multiple sugar transport system permease protein [Paenibacillus sp. UNCCL117]
MRLNLIPRYGLLTLLSILFVFPLYWMISGSFKTQVAIWAIPPQWFPSQLRLLNYEHIFTTTPALLWLWNSVFTSLVTVGFVVLFSAMAGYAYAKKTFPGDKLFFFVVIATMMMPTQVTLVPLYMICRELGLIDSYLGIILPAIAFPFGVFIVRQFAKSIPDEIIESARMDGTGEIRLFATIVLPLLLPALGALSIFAFMHTWNDYLWQLIILQSKEKLTLPLGISTITYSENSVNYGYAMAGASLAAVPMIAFFLLLQRSFIKGITLGSVKG